MLVFRRALQPLKEGTVVKYLSVFVSGTVSVHGGGHPAALLLHVDVRLDVRGGASYLPNANRAEEHQLWSHEVLLRHRLGGPRHHHR